jgi:hypothetical protein
MTTVASQGCYKIINPEDTNVSVKVKKAMISLLQAMEAHRVVRG